MSKFQEMHKILRAKRLSLDRVHPLAEIWSWGQLSRYSYSWNIGKEILATLLWMTALCLHGVLCRSHADEHMLLSVLDKTNRLMYHLAICTFYAYNNLLYITFVTPLLLHLPVSLYFSLFYTPTNSERYLSSVHPHTCNVSAQCLVGASCCSTVIYAPQLSLADDAETTSFCQQWTPASLAILQGYFLARV